MPVCQQGCEGLVVELDHLWSPEDQHGERAGEGQDESVEQGLRPALDRTESGQAPILLPDEIGDPTLAADQMGGARMGVVPGIFDKWSQWVVQVGLNLGVTLNVRESVSHLQETPSMDTASSVLMRST